MYAIKNTTGGFMRKVTLQIVEANGGIKPFLNVSVHELLWGYQDGGVSVIKN